VGGGEAGFGGDGLSGAHRAAEGALAHHSASVWEVAGRRAFETVSHVRSSSARSQEAQTVLPNWSERVAPG
jgi:hypothetical protein